MNVEAGSIALGTVFWTAALDGSGVRNVASSSLNGWSTLLVGGKTIASADIDGSCGWPCRASGMRPPRSFRMRSIIALASFTPHPAIVTGSLSTSKVQSRVLFLLKMGNQQMRAAQGSRKTHWWKRLENSIDAVMRRWYPTWIWLPAQVMRRCDGGICSRSSKRWSSSGSIA